MPTFIVSSGQKFSNPSETDVVPFINQFINGVVAGAPPHILSDDRQNALAFTASRDAILMNGGAAQDKRILHHVDFQIALEAVRCLLYAPEDLSKLPWEPLTAEAAEAALNPPLDPRWAPPTLCPRGQGPMDRGFILDYSDRSQTAAEWAPGAPESALFGGIHRPPNRRRIATYRCRACGYLESYAL